MAGAWPGSSGARQEPTVDRTPSHHRATHTPSHTHSGRGPEDTSSPHEHISGVWEEPGVSREDIYTHGEPGLSQKDRRWRWLETDLDQNNVIREPCCIAFWAKYFSVVGYYLVQCRMFSNIPPSVLTNKNVSGPINCPPAPEGAKLSQWWTTALKLPLHSCWRLVKGVRLLRTRVFSFSFVSDSWRV